MIFTFLLSIFISALIAYGATFLVRKFFISRSWVEDPQDKQRKTGNATHQQPIPRGGGLPVFLAIFTSAFCLLPFSQSLWGIFLAALLTLVVGLWDDVRDISPKIRLVSNILAASVVVLSGIGIAYVSNPFGGIIDLSHPQISLNFFGPRSLWILSDLLALIWIVWCTNITGWAAGVAGQLPGFVSISALFIGILSLRFSSDNGQWPVIILAGAVAGAYLGFLPHNFLPQTIMPGYSGKSLAGLMLSILAILSGAKLATVILLLGIPIIDAAFVIIKRLVERRPIIIGGPDHLHHYLLSRGFSQKQVAYFYWLMSAILGTLSLFLNSQQKFYVFIGLVVLFLGYAAKSFQRT